MLTMMDRSQVPDHGGRARSPMRAFARQALSEFFEVSAPGDVAEVTGSPAEAGPRGTSALAGALREELYQMFRERRKEVGGDGSDPRRIVRVMTRGGERVFLERLIR